MNQRIFLAIYLSLFVSVNFVITSVFANELPSDTQFDATVSQAVFSESINNNERLSLHGIGIVWAGTGGTGLTYQNRVSPNTFFWAQTIFFNSVHVFLDEQRQTKNVANVDVNEKNRILVMFGADQIFHATQNKYWGFLLGMGIGYEQVEYNSTYYKESCGYFYCGYDKSSGVQVFENDRNIFIPYRIGVSILDTQVWELKGNLNVAIQGKVARLPQDFKFVAPDGSERANSINNNLLIEYTVLF